MAQAQTTDLVVTMTDTPDPVQPGGTITYTITPTSNGSDPAVNISLDDTLPSGTTMGSITVDAPGWTLTAPVAGGTGTVTSTFPGPFNPGDEVVFTLIVNVKPATPGGTVITNSATAPSPSDPTIANNTGTTTTTVAGAVPTMGAMSLAAFALLLLAAGAWMVRRNVSAAGV